MINVSFSVSVSESKWNLDSWCHSRVRRCHFAQINGLSGRQKHLAVLPPGLESLPAGLDLCRQVPERSRIQKDLNCASMVIQLK